MKRIMLAIVCLTALAMAVQGVAAPQKDYKRLKRDLRLHFKPAHIEAPQSHKSFAVVRFRDRREQNNIGETQKHDIYAEPELVEWIGYSFYEQMLYNGYTVEYFESLDDVEGSFDFIITGDVNKYYFKHNALLQFEAEAAVTFYAYGKQVDVLVVEGEDKTTTRVKTRNITIKREARESEYRTALGVNFDDEVLAEELANLFDDMLGEFVHTMNKTRTRP